MLKKFIVALKTVCGYCGYNTSSSTCPNCGNPVG